MIELGLIGYPLGHSMSPRLHESALRSCGLDGHYSLFPIPPEDKQGLKELLARVRNGEISGLNVTIPHKQNVIELLDELTPTAKAIGAVNTIYRQDDKLIGENTDAPGFLSDLKRFLTTEPQSHRELSGLVFGAGGSARAVVYALLNDGWELTIAARRIDQIQQLLQSFSNHNLQTTDLALSNIDPSNIVLLVNTTPIGMTPNIDRSPWPENVAFPPRAVVYDLVYNPHETKLVRDACSQGRAATTGLGMLIDQAALAFEIWTGHKPSREIMLEAVNQATRS